MCWRKFKDTQEKLKGKNLSQKGGGWGRGAIFPWREASWTERQLWVKRKGPRILPPEQLPPSYQWVEVIYIILICSVAAGFVCEHRQVEPLDAPRFPKGYLGTNFILRGFICCLHILVVSMGCSNRIPQTDILVNKYLFLTALLLDKAGKSKITCQRLGVCWGLTSQFMDLPSSHHASQWWMGAGSPLGSLYEGVDPIISNYPPKPCPNYYLFGG